MFMLFEFMFPIIFVMVFGMIIFQFVTGIGTWHKSVTAFVGERNCSCKTRKRIASQPPKWR